MSSRPGVKHACIRQGGILTALPCSQTAVFNRTKMPDFVILPPRLQEKQFYLWRLLFWWCNGVTLTSRLQTAGTDIYTVATVFSQDLRNNTCTSSSIYYELCLWDTIDLCASPLAWQHFPFYFPWLVGHCSSTSGWLCHKTGCLGKVRGLLSWIPSATAKHIKTAPESPGSLLSGNDSIRLFLYNHFIIWE